MGDNKANQSNLHPKTPRPQIQQLSDKNATEDGAAVTNATERVEERAKSTTAYVVQKLVSRKRGKTDRAKTTAHPPPNPTSPPPTGGGDVAHTYGSPPQGSGQRKEPARPPTESHKAPASPMADKARVPLLKRDRDAKKQTWKKWSIKKLLMQRTAPIDRETPPNSATGVSTHAEEAPKGRRRKTRLRKDSGAATIGRAVERQASGTGPAGAGIHPTAQRSVSVGSGTQPAKKYAVHRAQGALLHSKKSGTTAVVKGAAKVFRRIVVAAAKAIQAIVTALAPILGIVGVVLVLFVVVAAVVAVIASPFGLLFSNENTEPGTIPVATAVGQLKSEFSSSLDDLQAGYDGAVIHGSMADWPEVLAVFAVHTAGRDDPAATDVLTIDAERVERLAAVFWDANPVRTEVEEMAHSGDDDEEGWTELILHIYIESRTAVDMAEIYKFTTSQRQMLEEMLTDYRDMLITLASDLTITDVDALAVLERLPADLSATRRAAVEKALELVGKVSYFWGGKSSAIGWDERWGTIMQVTAPGSSTTGKYIPFGLDCTGCATRS